MVHFHNNYSMQSKTELKNSNFSETGDLDEHYTREVTIWFSIALKFYIMWGKARNWKKDKKYILGNQIERYTLAILLQTALG